MSPSRAVLFLGCKNAGPVCWSILFGFSLGNSRLVATTGDHVEAVRRECRIVSIEQRQVLIPGLWVTGLIFGQDATNPVERCLIPMSHQFGKDLKRVREVVQLLTSTGQGKVPRLDEGTVQDAQ